MYYPFDILQRIIIMLPTLAKQARCASRPTLHLLAKGFSTNAPKEENRPAVSQPRREFRFLDRRNH